MPSLADRQFHLITRKQALAEGCKPWMIERWLAQNWRSIHPGIYALQPLDWKGELMAACLWAGEDAVVSHRAAATLWQLPGASVGRPEITVTRCHLPPRSGIIVHHTQRLPDPQRARLDGLPVTSIERTLLDLGAVWSKIKVATAIDDALRRGLTTLEALDECLRITARRGRRGCRVLRDLIKERTSGAVPESPLETRLFQLLAAWGGPKPELQYEIRDGRGFVARVDFCFPEAKVIIEADSFKHHSRREDWSKDHRKRARLLSLGYRIVVVTWDDVTDFPDATLARIAEVLRHAS